jgi:hypothetical protein
VQTLKSCLIRWQVLQRLDEAGGVPVNGHGVTRADVVEQSGGVLPKDAKKKSQKASGGRAWASQPANLRFFDSKTACTRLFQMACASTEGSNCSARLGYRVDSLCRSKGAQKSWQS